MGVESFAKGGASRFRGVGRRSLLQVVGRGLGGGSGQGVCVFLGRSGEGSLMEVQDVG